MAPPIMRRRFNDGRESAPVRQSRLRQLMLWDAADMEVRQDDK